jgi:hypothetical protein
MEILERSFRFVNGDLQADLLALVQRNGVRYSVDGDGTLRYASTDAEVVENELICSIRDCLFPMWSIFTLEGDETPRPNVTAAYRAYMSQHSIPFAEEVADGFTWFLVPDGVDSFEWGIQDLEDEEPGG